MGTWHQNLRPAKLWHETEWSVVVDPPNRTRSVTRFYTEAEAKTYVENYKKLLGPHAYILPPAKRKNPGSVMSMSEIQAMRAGTQSGRLVDIIRPGDRVTIVNRFGQQRSGRAVMPSSAGGWVLSMGGPHGTPALADDRNIVKVKKRRG